MKRLLLIFYIFFAIGRIGFSQNSVEPLKEKLDTLQSIKAELSDSLSVIREQIDKIESKIGEIEFNKFKKGKKILSLKSSSDIFSANDITSTRIGAISAGSKVALIYYDGGFFVKINYDGKEGFILKHHFKKEKMLEELGEKTKKMQKAEEKLVSSMIDSIEQDPRWVKSFNGNLRKDPTTNSEIITQLEQGEEVFVQDQNREWLKIKYIVDQSLKKNLNNKDDINSVYHDAWIHKSITSKQEIRKLSTIQRKGKRRRMSFVRNNSGIKQQYKQDILNGSIRIGMTKDMVRASWGPPNDINRTVTSYSTREQWVYSVSTSRYVYFEDGIMTSFQD